MDGQNYSKDFEFELMLNKKNHDKDLKFEFIFNIFPASLWWMDINHIYRGCNPAAWRALGLNSSQEYIGKTIFDFAKILNWPQDKAQDFYDLDERILQTKIQSITQDIIWQSKERFITQTGCKKPLLDKDGQVIGLIGIGIPNKLNDIQINYSKSNKQDIAPNNGHLSDIELFQMAPASIWWMNLDHIYLGCNIETCRWIGAKSPDEVIGRDISDLAKLNDWPQFRSQEIYDMDKRIIKSEIPELNTDNILPQGNKGAPIHHYGFKHPIFNEDKKVIGLMGAGIVVDSSKEMHAKEI